MKTRRCLAIALIIVLMFIMLSACQKDDFGMGEPGAALNVPEVPDDDELEEEMNPVTETETEPETEAQTEEKTEETEPEPEPEPEAEPEPEIDPEPEFLYYNPLTGESCDTDYNGFRPYTIMLDNVADGIPQDGISYADIVYEVTVEGGATRCMGVFIDIGQAEYIGGVRSCRTTFVDIAKGYDSIYIHAGGSNEGNAELARIGLTDIDALASSWFFREKWRSDTIGYEHSLVANTEEILANVEGRGYRVMHEDGFSIGLNFAEEPELPDAVDATSVEVCLSSKKTNFDFDAETGKYLATEYQKDWVDHLTGSRLSFENLLLIKTPCRITGGMYYTHTTTGSGDGFYFNNGKVVEIKWSRETLDDPFVYTYADGTPITLGAGKTYIGLVTGQGYVKYN